MKDTPSSITTTDEHIHSPSEPANDTATSKDTIAQPHNDENKNIILFDDDNNQTILSTSNSDNKTLSQTQIITTPKKFIDDECTPTKLANNDSDSNEMSTSQTETPLPDWIALNESGAFFATENNRKSFKDKLLKQIVWILFQSLFDRTITAAWSASLDQRIFRYVN